MVEKLATSSCQQSIEDDFANFLDFDKNNERWNRKASDDFDIDAPDMDFGDQ